MGGGGIIRTVAREAAVGGSFFSASLADQIAGAASRKKLPSNTASPALAEAAPLSPLTSTTAPNSHVGTTVSQKSSFQIDDWVLPSVVEDELLLAESLPHTRLVFGPLPTLEEAKEATSYLTDAIGKMYFSPATEYELSEKLVPTTPSNKNVLVGMSTRSLAHFHSERKPVYQAFSLLLQSPEAQNVVASLASDKNVWDAVQKNEKVLEFYKSHLAGLESDGPDCHEIVAKPPESSLDSTAKPSYTSSILKLIRNVKCRLLKITMAIPAFIEDLLGLSSEPSSPKNESNYTIPTFVALAIVVIVIVLFKRV